MNRVRAAVRGPDARAAAVGALAGLVAGAAMLLATVLLRLRAGVPLPTELVTDRLLPLVPVDLFLEMLNRMGGAIRAKQIGYFSAFAAQVALAVALGAAYGVLARRGRPAAAVIGGVLALLLVILVAALWPELDANYDGVPAGRARLLTIAALAATFALHLLVVVVVHRLLTAGRPAVDGAGGTPMARRAFLAAGAGVVIGLAGLGSIRALYRRGAWDYDGLSLRGGPGVPPVTPTDLFYTVTKNLVDPRIDPGSWRLEVDGHVERAMRFSLDDLRAMPPVEQVQTLECISNSVGGGLISNGEWTGVPLAGLIALAGPRPGATQAFVHGADGYTNEIDMERATNPTTLLAYGLNGVPLDQRHGRPCRLLVPGSYGERSVKWITRIEIREDPAEGYYTRQGWVADPVSTMSRFLHPPRDGALEAGTVRLEGAAFAGDRGIERVEVSTDGGRTWRPARIDYAPSPIAWTLWSLDWRARPGDHLLVVRAVDGTGEAQVTRDQGIAPNGSKGLHRVRVTVA